MHFWNKNMRLIRKVARKPIDMARLDGEVELALQGASKLGHDLDWCVAARLGHFVLDQVGKVVKKPQVRCNLGRNAGTSDLEDDRRAARQFGPVHLRNRGCSMRLALDVGKHVEGRSAKRLFYLRQQLSEGNRCDFAVPSLKLGDPARRKQIWPCRQHLAELDKRRPKILERAPEALLWHNFARLAGFAQVQNLPGPLKHGGQLVRRTRSPRPCRMRTALISRSRDRSRTAPCVPQIMGGPILLSSIRSGR